MSKTVNAPKVWRDPITGNLASEFVSDTGARWQIVSIANGLYHAILWPNALRWTPLATFEYGKAWKRSHNVTAPIDLSTFEHMVRDFCAGVRP